MSATWPNEPSGATARLDHNFSTVLGPSMYDPYNTAGLASSKPSAYSLTIRSDGSAPVSPSSCMVSAISAGSTGGGTELHWYDSAVRDSMFVGMMWRTNAAMQLRTTANKMWFMRGPSVNGFFGIAAFNAGSGNTFPVYVYFGHNTGSLDNSHIMQGDLGLIGPPNVQAVPIYANTWTRLEAYIKKSTTSTSRDGIVKWWVNGILCGSYTTVNYAPNGLNEWVWSETWDGTVTNPVPSVAWEHWVDHLYVSTGGTVGSGGGTPPPEPEPPPPVEVVLSSITPSNLSTVVGTSKQFTISMSGPVASNTSLFTTSSNTGVATVPDSVTIQSGSSTALVTATPVAVGSTTISTSYNGVTKAATLQVGTSGTTTGSTVYDYSTQFSGTQGQDNWYYLEHDGTQMAYSGGGAVWVGSDTYGGSLQTIWGNGFHPGGLRASVLRFVVPAAGSATVAGSFYDLDTGGGTGVVARVQHNGVTLFTRTIANGETTGGAYSLTVTVAAGDQIDFVVANQTSDYQNNSTSLNPVITLAAVSTEPTPPPPPAPPTSVVDFFTTASVITVGTAFTMTVRVSETVAADTTVEIRVGSTVVLSAPTSVTVASGASTASFNVTPLIAGLVAIEAILNGIKRVTLNVQPATPPPPTEPDPGPSTDPSVETKFLSIVPSPDGARLVLNQPARSVAFKYDALADWEVIVTYPLAQTEFSHTFTWPSGTTTICYRAQAIDGTWGPALCRAYAPPLQPVPPRPEVKSLVDKFGIRWQLAGKKSPYTLKRNGSAMDNTYGRTLRKSSDGYLEILQTNNIWLRRVDDAWEPVE